DRLARLGEANSLLQELHQVAQTLPASLDLNETVRSTAQRLRYLLDPDVVAVLLREPGHPQWLVAACEGARLDAPPSDEALPGPVRRALAEHGTVLVADLNALKESGLTFPARSGLYVSLRARGALI